MLQVNAVASLLQQQFTVFYCIKIKTKEVFFPALVSSQGAEGAEEKGV